MLCVLILLIFSIKKSFKLRLKKLIDQFSTVFVGSGSVKFDTDPDSGSSPTFHMDPDSGSSPTFHTDPDPGKLYGSGGSGSAKLREYCRRKIKCRIRKSVHCS